MGFGIIVSIAGICFLLLIVARDRQARDRIYAISSKRIGIDEALRPPDEIRQEIFKALEFHKDKVFEEMHHELLFVFGDDWREYLTEARYNYAVPKMPDGNFANPFTAIFEIALAKKGFRSIWSTRYRVYGIDQRYRRTTIRTCYLIEKYIKEYQPTLYLIVIPDENLDQSNGFNGMIEWNYSILPKSGKPFCLSDLES